MFCGNCGANNPDGSSVCGSCGAALTPEENASSSGSIMDKIPGNNKMVGIIAVAVAAVVAVIIVALIAMTVLGGGGAKGAAVKYVKASFSPTGGKDLVSLVPAERLEMMLDDSDDYDTKAELIQDINDYLEDFKDDLEDEYGKYKIKIEVRKVDDWNNKTIKAYNNRLEDRDYDMEIKDGANVKLRVTINGKDGKDSDSVTIPVVKIGSKWYIDFMSESVYGM